MSASIELYIGSSVMRAHACLYGSFKAESDFDLLILNAIGPISADINELVLFFFISDGKKGGAGERLADCKCAG